MEDVQHFLVNVDGIKEFVTDRGRWEITVVFDNGNCRSFEVDGRQLNEFIESDDKVGYNLRRLKHKV